MIAFCVVATNKYIKYVDDLVASIEKYCAIQFKVIVYTNENYSRRNVEVVKIKHEPWPYPTLKRYHYMTTESWRLNNCTHMYYIDADMRMVGPVDTEIIGDYVGVLHPGFFNKNVSEYPYERNAASNAYIPYGKGEKYYCGGFNGGKTDLFLNMCTLIRGHIDSDLSRNIIAVWHDESYLNKFYSINKPTTVLSPSYCFPETWKIGMQPKIIALDKNHEEVRS